MDQEYRTVEKGCGWRLRAERGRLRFTGRDRTTFLQALLTNDVSALREGAGVYSTYLTPQGRMIADLHLFDRGESLLADVPAALAATLAAAFDRLVFAEDVHVTDESASLGQIQMFGRRSPEVLARVFDLDAARLDALPPLGHVAAGDAFLARTDDAPGGTWDAFVPIPRMAEVTDALAREGAVALSAELADALRIDRGRPAWGVDMDETTIPLEAGLLERAISTTKGCYVGQEVIVRVLHRGGGRVAKRLMRMTCESTAASDAPSTVPAAGSSIVVDGREVGRVTSAAWSPRAQKIVALGYVARDAADDGADLTIVSGEMTRCVEAASAVS